MALELLQVIVCEDDMDKKGLSSHKELLQPIPQRQGGQRWFIRFAA